MPFLLPSDFTKLIQQVQLNQLLTTDAGVLDDVIFIVMAEVRTHLIQKYDIDSVLTETSLWSNTKSYLPNDRVYANTSGVIDIYYGKTPYPLFNLYTQYAVGDNVYYNGHSWKALRASILPVPSIQYGSYANIPPPNVFPTTANNAYWQDLGAVTIAAGTSLTDVTKWVKGDNRNTQLMVYMADMALYHLHARIAPTNVPALRVERYMGKDQDRTWKDGQIFHPDYCALGWLQGCANGRLTPQLPLIQPKQGGRIIWGSTIKSQTDY